MLPVTPMPSASSPAPVSDYEQDNARGDGKVAARSTTTRKPSVADGLASRAATTATPTSIVDGSCRPRAPSAESPGGRNQRRSSEISPTQGNDNTSDYARSEVSSAVVTTHEKFASLAHLVTARSPHGMEQKAKTATHDAIVHHFQLRRVSGEMAEAYHTKKRTIDDAKWPTNDDSTDDHDDHDDHDGSDDDDDMRHGHGNAHADGSLGSLGRLFAHRRQRQVHQKQRKFHDSVRDLKTRRDSDVEVGVAAGRGVVCRRLTKSRRRLSRALCQFVTRTCLVPFSPTGFAVRLRSVLALSAMLSQLFFVPFAAVYFPRGSRATTALAVTFDVVFLLDLLTRLWNTAYYDDKAHRLEFRRAKILKRYVRVRGAWWLFVDVVACLPLDVVLLVAGSQPIHAAESINTSSSATSTSVLAGGIPRALVRVLHWHSLLPAAVSGVARMLRASSKLSFRLLVQRHTVSVQVARMALVLMLATHYVACLWRATLTADADTDVPNDPWTQYLGDLLTSTQLLVGHLPLTSMTTSAADHVRIATSETIFGICATLFGGLVLSLVTGLVALLLASISTNSARYQRKLGSVLASMDKLQLPPQLRRRVHQYYDHLWNEHAATDTAEITAFTDALSPSLALEVNLFRHMDLVLGVSFWRNCSADFVTQIMAHLEVRAYLPEDYIMRQGEIGDDLFLINRGVCELRAYPTEDDHATVAAVLIPKLRRRRLTAGTAFGELALLMNYRRTATVRALTFVEMCVLSRHAFQQILARYRDDRREVLREMLLSCIEKKTQRFVPFPYEELVAKVSAQRETAAPPTPWEAAEILLNLIDVPDWTDESVKFGFRDLDFVAQHRLVPVAASKSHSPIQETESSTLSTSPPSQQSQDQAAASLIEPQPPTDTTSKILTRLKAMEQWQIHTTERLAALDHGMNTVLAELTRLTSILAPSSSSDSSQGTK